MASMFDLKDNFDPAQTTGKSLYDMLLAQRAQLEQTRPDVAAQLPVLGAATPGERMYQAEQAQPVMNLADTVQGVSQAVAQASVPQGAKPKDLQAAQQGNTEILDSINPLKPLPQYGPQGFGRALGMPENAGGILGLGVQPIDILGFAIGAALGRGQSPEAAMKTAMWGASLPRAFRENQEKNALEFVRAKQNELNSQIAGQNAELRGQELAARTAETARKTGILNAINQRLATGQPLTAQERIIIAANAHGVFDPSFVKEFVAAPDLATQTALITQAQQFAKDAGMGSVSATLDLPGGMKVTLGNPQGSSGRAVVTGELADAIATRTLSPKLQAAGFTDTPQGWLQVEDALKRRQALETQRIDISRTNSNRAQTALEMIRPEESKKLTALQELHRGASDMLGKFEASLASHGGKLPPGIQAAIQAATTSPDGLTGKLIQSLGQRYPGLTQQDFDFIARYASMQKFARGSLNDVGNLSNYERGIFNTMVGTPLDDPRVFRSRTNTALSDAAVAYDQEYRSLGTTRNLEQFPSGLGTPKKEQAAPAQAGPVTELPKGAVVRRFNPRTGKFE